MAPTVGFTHKSAADLKRLRRGAYLAVVEVGDRSEDRAEEALRFLVQKGEIFNYERCQKNGENDRKQRDFLIFPGPDWIIPFQVKSSEARREDHISKHGTRIPCGVVRKHVAIDILAEEFLQDLGLSTKFLKKEIERAKSEPFNTLVEELLKIFNINEEETTLGNTSIDEFVSA